MFKKGLRFISKRLLIRFTIFLITIAFLSLATFNSFSAANISDFTKNNKIFNDTLKKVVSVNTSSSENSETAINIYYYRGFTTPYICYRELNSKWKDMKTVRMSESEFDGYSFISVDVGSEDGITSMFSNGKGLLNNNNGKGFKFAPGVYTVKGSKITQGDPEGNMNPVNTIEPSPIESTPTPEPSSTEETVATSTPEVTPEITPAPSSSPRNGLTVHFKKPDGWNTPSVYYYQAQPKAPDVNWNSAPAMKDEGNGWYVYTIEGAESAMIMFKDDKNQIPPPSKDGFKRDKEGWFDGTNWSDTNINKPAVPVISIDPPAGKYKVTQTIELKSSNSSDKIYYTKDGSTPTKTSALYSSPITVSSGKIVIKAIGVNQNGETGQVATFEYVVDPNIDDEKPSINASIPSGQSETAVAVKFTVKDNNKATTKVYYTEDGTAPTKSSDVYVSGNAVNGISGSQITVAKTTTIRLLAVDGSGNETLESFTYRIGKVAAKGDFREESIYFVMTARFYDGDTSNDRYCRADDKSGNRANNDPPWRGDFKGLIEKLDYIKALGFTAVWITPVVLNRSDFDFHGYHAWDFTQVDPRLESPGASYQDLINEAHKRGMKIIQDIVLNHSSRYGIKDFAPVKYWGDSSDPQWGDGTKMDYYDVENPNFTYNGLDAEPNSGKTFYNGDLWQKEKPTLPWNPDLSQWGKPTNYTSPEGYKIYGFQWPNLALFDPSKYHTGWLKNWEDETCQTGTIHEDCIDLDTESKSVQDYLINAYNKYIDMGVDGFRIDTVKHISRNTFNRAFIPAFKKRGGENFFMFGEVCTRVNEVWNHGNAPLSAPFYTWKERKEYSADDHTAAHEAYEYEYNQGPANQPTSDNYLLKGNEYHKPDYSKSSGMGVIDFPMHWNFSDASSAFNMKGNDQFYNDATWNVVYVDSHDYGPNTDNRYAGGTDAWAENMDLMFTFRGIPCLYYGSEIEFQKGAIADKGPVKPLAETGRAYYGDNIVGSVTTSDFGIYSNATGKMADTLTQPLSKHVARLNRIRREIPALQKGQYSTDNVSGGIAYKKRFTDKEAGVDSFALITISGNATFSNIPNGTYVDAVTGDKKVVSNGSLSISCSGKGNMRVYVLDLPGNPAPGKIGEDGNYLK